MRDPETIRLALSAAETGHLVFGTLHTSSAAKTIDRIVDVFPAAEKAMVRSMLSESLKVVISQTLMKKIGGGRIAAHEIMIGTPAIRNLIREDKIAQMYSAIQTGQNVGMQTLDQNLKSLLEIFPIIEESAGILPGPLLHPPMAQHLRKMHGAVLHAQLHGFPPLHQCRFNWFHTRYDPIRWNYNKSLNPIILEKPTNPGYSAKNL